jgi:hypothetical protein
MHRTALFSHCGTFRYRLGRRWAEGPKVAFVLLNPSVANTEIDDQTVRRASTSPSATATADLRW